MGGGKAPPPFWVAPKTPQSAINPLRVKRDNGVLWGDVMPGIGRGHSDLRFDIGTDIAVAIRHLAAYLDKTRPLAFPSPFSQGGRRDAEDFRYALGRIKLIVHE